MVTFTDDSSNYTNIFLTWKFSFTSLADVSKETLYITLGVICTISLRKKKVLNLQEQ